MVELIDASENFNALWDIYLEAFPRDEQRPKEEIISLMDTPNFYFEGIYVEKKCCGLVCYRELGDFIFIEYLAMHANSRGSGAGSAFLHYFIEKYNGEKIILEVEHPVEDIQKRRVGFYERKGFHYNDKIFMAPQTIEGGQELPLNFMSYPLLLGTQEYEQVKKLLLDKVYNED
ncbi:GNAT family N-acetyltransferase [Flammeovirga pectinis]|uniref:GNAT family N-acetyltransferase n=1 Tax=Flammeovirga pectinis TaxID=2494373 RepID=A0A3Q9FNC9_9BACT|nr:GNAT family N-acetyltransferase [Flammeovirga pectinis]AZQ61632.1 GNAT family N-acetyltransferase [Flammeovirga pectinis]